MSTFDLKKIIKEEMAKLNEAKQTIRLDDLTFDGLKAAFPKKYQKAFTTRRGVDGEQEDMYRDTESVSFPKVGSMQTILSNSALEDWKEEFRKRYGNVDVELDPEAKEWFNLVVINDPKFVKDKETNDAAVSSFMRESVINEANPAGLSKEETLKVAQKFADAIAEVDGVKVTVNMETLEEDSFDLDYDGTEFDGGSYNINADGSVVNMAVRKQPTVGTKDDDVKTIVKFMKKHYGKLAKNESVINESTKKHIKTLMEARLKQVNIIKEGVMAELDIIMDEASDFKDFLKRINRDSRLETSLLNSPDMIKFFTKIWKESGRSL